LRRDLHAEKFTLPDTQELVECLRVKFNEMILLRSAPSARYFAGLPIGFNLLASRCSASRMPVFCRRTARARISAGWLRGGNITKRRGLAFTSLML
jgi:hypothetical protein